MAMIEVDANWRTWPAPAKQALLARLRERTAMRTYERYQADPVGFVREVLRAETVTEQQIGVLESVRDHSITVVQSANAVGKTHVAASVALWFLRAFPHAEVYTAAAPPVENLERLLWGEINSRLLARPEVFEDARQGYLEVQLAPNWFLVGVAIPIGGNPAQREAKFSGKHAPHLLFIVDEGDAVPDEVYRGIESCMSGGHARLLVMFNPREQAGPVYRMIRSNAHVVTIDAFSHPNVVTGEDRIPGAVTRERTVRRIAEWSRPALAGDEPRENDPDWFMVPAMLDGATAPLDDGTTTLPLQGGQMRRIVNPALAYMTLARFPGQAENQLISRAWVEAAMQRWQAWQVAHGEQPPAGVQPVLGLDVAELGGDQNVACLRYAGYVAGFEAWSGVDVLVSGDRAAEMARAAGARLCCVDATGVGAGTSPQMRRRWDALEAAEMERIKGNEELMRAHVVYEGRVSAVKVASSPTVKVEEGEFEMLRDQLWWLMREWLRTDRGAMLPPDEALADELCAATYRVQRGRIRIEDKESLRRKLHRSPDRADALGLTFAPDEGALEFGWA